MSDQDFFFDEDEQPAPKTAEKTAGKVAEKAAPKAAKPAAPKGAAAKVQPEPAVQVGGVELTWTITALIGVVALLLGVIVGYSIPKGTSVSTAGTTTTGQTQNAPQLSPEQMQSGQLPAGHPDISSMGGTTPTDTTSSGTATTTP